MYIKNQIKKKKKKKLLFILLKSLVVRRNTITYYEKNTVIHYNDSKSFQERFEFLTLLFKLQLYELHFF